MGEHHRRNPEPIRELAEDISVMIGSHEDGLVVIELGEGEDAEAFIMHPAFAEALGNDLFKAAQDAKANIERGRQDRGISGD